MKKMFILGTAIFTTCVLANGLDIAHKYQDAIDAYKAEKNPSKAKMILEKLAGLITKLDKVCGF